MRLPRRDAFACAGATLLLALGGPATAEAPDAGTGPAPRKPHPSCPDAAPPKLPLPKGPRSHYPPGCGRGTGDCQYLLGLGSPALVPPGSVPSPQPASPATSTSTTGRVRAARMGPPA